ncbi:hypothetical protein LOAG_03378 [Loa loa]|uniref:Uncharacterized protein n=1 Tax=Loa loa TaxID=7209 RepID=A0A1S0U4M5_LOALO|nr:hypothetical protein LOAG_03378 [Loa loa]EFO25111.1 hypothetical protein LOAG_03378 [Loa loa]
MALAIFHQERDLSNCIGNGFRFLNFMPKKIWPCCTDLIQFFCSGMLRYLVKSSREVWSILFNYYIAEVYYFVKNIWTSFYGPSDPKSLKKVASVQWEYA